MMIIKNAKADAKAQVSYKKNRQTLMLSFGIRKLLLLLFTFMIAVAVIQGVVITYLEDSNIYLDEKYGYTMFVLKTQFRVLYNRYIADYDMFLRVMGTVLLTGMAFIVLSSLIKSALEGIFIGEKYVMINTYKDNDADIRDYKRSFRNYKRNFAAIFLYELIINVPFVLYLPAVLLAAEHIFSGLRFYSADEYYIVAVVWLLSAAGLIYICLKAASYLISLVYRMTLFIIADDDEISASDALRRSRELTENYRIKEFVFDISFIGYWLIGILACIAGGQIGSIIYDLLVYYPYYGMSSVNFYRTLKEISIGRYEELPPYID